MKNEGKKIKVGLIGFGRMGNFYFQAMQKSGKWDIAYICDKSTETRDNAKRLSPSSKIVSDEQVIFEDPEVEVVGLFALADSRKAQIEKAVQYGKHIMSEKPIADTAEKEWEVVRITEGSSSLRTAIDIGNQCFTN